MIDYYESVEFVKEKYGLSPLASAFEDAKNLGAPHVFLMNIRTPERYIEAANILRHYDFTYIVPIGLFMSDFFYNKIHGTQMQYYFEYFLRALSLQNNSTLIVTDKHASLYADIDHFLDEMLNISRHFKSKIYTQTLIKGENIYFAANNLQNYSYANVAMAAALCSTPLNKYPEGNFGPTVFYIDNFDIKDNELVFFKNNYLRNTTISNYVNYYKEQTQNKVGTTDRIVKYLIRELDFSEFVGKIANEYYRMKIEKKIAEFMENQKGYVLIDYEIDPSRMFQISPGASIFESEIAIRPINTQEQAIVVIQT